MPCIFWNTSLQQGSNTRAAMIRNNPKIMAKPAILKTSAAQHRLTPRPFTPAQVASSLSPQETKDIETSLAGMRSDKLKAEAAAVNEKKVVKKTLNVGKGGGAGVGGGACRGC